MLELCNRVLSDTEAVQLASWRYPPPYDLYDGEPASIGVLRARDGQDGYYPAVGSDGVLVGFVVYGSEARVRGQQPEPGTVDLGAGIRPDLVSNGLGTELVAQGIALARTLFAPTRLRTAVASFNLRSLALCRAAGLVPVAEFGGPAGRPFTELVRDCPP